MAPQLAYGREERIGECGKIERRLAGSREQTSWKKNGRNGLKIENAAIIYFRQHPSAPSMSTHAPRLEHFDASDRLFALLSPAPHFPFLTQVKQSSSIGKVFRWSERWIRWIPLVNRPFNPLNLEERRICSFSFRKLYRFRTFISTSWMNERW